MTLEKWIPFRREGAGVRSRLFAFPHAAGNAAIYRPLRSLMPPDVDLCPVELPGRAARVDEPPFNSMNLLMERLNLVLQPLMTVPFGFFGHSVGAWTAFEAARRLRAADGRTAVHLFVSGRNSPNRSVCSSQDRLPPSNEDLLSILLRFAGTPSEILQRPELMAVLLPVLRADLALIDGYSVEPGHRIACGITAFGGSDDLSYSGLLQSWSDFTLEKFRSCIFRGGHFYFSCAAGALAREIVEDMRASASKHAATAG